MSETGSEKDKETEIKRGRDRKRYVGPGVERQGRGERGGGEGEKSRSFCRAD